MRKLNRDKPSELDKNHNSLSQLIKTQSNVRYPLSYTQEQIWLEEVRNPNTATYHIPILYHLKGQIDYKKLCLALNQVVARHDSLRSSIYMNEGKAYQQVSTYLEISCPLIDLRNHKNPDETAANLIQEILQVPFNLEVAPLLRFQLIHLDDTEYLFFIVFHHLIFDGSSQAIFEQDLAYFYKTFINEPVMDLPSVSNNFGTYALWQRKQVKQAINQGKLDFWRKQLTDMPGQLGFPRLSLQNSDLNPLKTYLELPIAYENLEIVLQFAQKEGFTLYVVLLACYRVLLGRYTGQWDGTVGGVMVDRIPQVRNVIGPFVRTILQRTILSPTLSFRDCLQAVRKTTVDIFEQAPLPFIQLVEALQPERSGAKNPFFQTMFALEDNSLEGLQLSETIELADTRLLETNTSKFDTSLIIRKVKNSYHTIWQYDTNLYDEAFIEQIAKDYLQLLQALVAEPEKAVGDMLLSSSRQLPELNIHKTDQSSETVIDWFETQVQETPDGIALSHAGQDLTYAELEKSVNQLAHYLQKCGIKQEEPVGILLPHNINYIISILAILKANAFFVPLDIAYPTQRIRDILRDSEMRFVLTEKVFSRQLLADDLDRILLDDASTRRAIHIQSTDVPNRRALHETHLAYMIYTSGSTGQPKGVMIEHRQLRHYIDWVRKEYFRTTSGTTPLFSSFAFDLTITSIFGPLVKGHRIDIVEMVTDLAWTDYLANINYPIGLLKVTPSHLEILNQLGISERLAGLCSTLIVGGEILYAKHIEAWLKANPDIVIINEYGPTETTVGCMVYQIRPHISYVGAIPIGQAINQMQIYILDTGRHLTAPGVIGEIYIGGLGVARGYHRQDELTQAVFLADVMPNQAGRLYKTGDLARYMLDGEIEFLGRADEQVKILGYRIEISEIETALLKHPNITRAAVIAQENNNAIELVAYWVSDTKTLTQNSLVEKLREQLPSYMIPGRFIQVDTLPHTINGKIDRHALADMETTLEPKKSIEQAQNLIQESIFQIWQDILQRDDFGIFQDFFVVGGNSLRAVQVFTHLQKTFGVSLSLRDLFDYRTIAQIADLIAEKTSNSPRQHVLKNSNFVVPPSRAVLSSLQKQIWLEEVLYPQKATYHIPVIYHLSNKPDIPVLESSLYQLLERHDSLRVRINNLDEAEPYQEFTQPFKISLEILEAYNEQEEAQIINEAILRPFDLQIAPLMRVMLIDCKEHAYRLLFVFHHIIFDGESLRIFEYELSELYNSQLKQSTPRLDKSSFYYGNYANFEKTHLTKTRQEDLTNFWQAMLNNSNPQVNLPLDGLREHSGSKGGRWYRNALSMHLIDQTLAFALSQESTLYIVLLAAFQVLIARYSQQWDSVIGTVFSNRQEANSKAIGMFANILPLRTSLSASQSFKEIVQIVRKSFLETYEHSDLSLLQLMDFLEWERQLGHVPFFKTMFTIEQHPQVGLVLDKLHISKRETLSTKTSKLELSLIVQENSNSWECLWEYDAALFSEDIVAQLARHYEQLLMSLLGDPNTAVGNLTFMSAEELHQILYTWNATATNYQANGSEYVRLIELQGMNRPKARAIVDGDIELSYDEFNRKANKLLNAMRAIGVQPRMIIGVLLPNSAEALIAMLAILKAGAVYLPLDVKSPWHRIQYMIEDSQLDYIIANSEDAEKIDRYKLIPIHIFAEDFSEEAIAYPVNSDDAAYIIYTSGSTGKPKGVISEHRNLNYLIDAHRTLINPEPMDRVLQFFSLNFDGSLFCICAALPFGAGLYIYKSAQTLDMQALNDFLQQQRITIAPLTPSLWRNLPGNDFPDIRYASTAGEACTPEIVDMWKHKGILHNLYGVTEASVWSLSYHFQNQDSKIRLGHPIPNTAIYILDENQQPLPIGVIGELYIAGQGLARAYINQTELNKERFLVDPFQKHASARMYRTGDLARYLPSGEIEFIGRADYQIKINGYRVELGEIEEQIRSHASVRDCVVLNIESDRQSYIVAYLLPDNKHEALNEHQWRQFLKGLLPIYMIPMRFITLEKFPLNFSHKTDRDALKEIYLKTQFEQHPRVLSSGSKDVDALMVNIWQDVLKRDDIDFESNFFELGGNSLNAMRLLSRIQKVFGTQLNFDALFVNPKISDLLELVLRAEKEVFTLPTAYQDRGENSPLSPAQERFWFLDQFEGQNASGLYNISQAIVMEGVLDTGVLAQSLSEIIASQNILRTRIFNDNGQARQIFIPPWLVDLVPIDLSLLLEKEQQIELHKLLLLEATKPFNLAEEPLIRLLLLHCSAERHVLISTFHHTIADGWSLQVFMKTLADLYTAILDQRSFKLKQPEIQYGDFARWEREQNNSTRYEKQLSYWLNHLSKEGASIKLPMQETGATKDYRAGKIRFCIDKSLVDTLQSLSKQYHVTRFMWLLAVFKVLMYRYSQQDDLSVGLAITNRPFPETENLIGPFLNTLPLRSLVNDDMTFLDFLESIRKNALDLYNNQDVPFEVILQALKPEHNLNQNPLFNILFNFVNLPSTDIQMAKLKLSVLEAPTLYSKFLMTIYVEDSPDNLVLSLVYRQSLFKQENAKFILDQYVELLRQVCRDVHRPLLEYSLVHPSFIQPADTQIPVQAYPRVAETFLTIAETYSENIAVRQGENTWSYRQLRNASQAIANALTASGLQSGDVIAYHGQRSFALIASMLGIHLCGGVILTIDPLLNEERKRYMLEISKARYLILPQQDQSSENNYPEQVVFYIHEDSGKIFPDPLHNSSTLTKTSNFPLEAAYIFFTSGSTGKPKAVLGSHQGLAHFIAWEREYLQVSENDVVAQLTTLSFDVMLRDIFLPLTSGARLELPRTGITAVSDNLLEWIKLQGVSILHVVPSIASAWLVGLKNTLSIPRLRHTLFAGELLSQKLVQSWREALDYQGDITNLYGPTETTLAKCFYRVPKHPETINIAVGRSLPQTEIMIMNRKKQLCGAFEPGEVIIRTAYRSLGYLNSACFVQNPMTDDEDDLVYCTGDTGYYTESGDLILTGRIDNQLKVRGVRIAPFEIEQVLRQLPEIKDVVIALQEQSNQAYLTAYLVPEANTQLNISGIREFLRLHLPPYLIPDLFVMLEKIPLNSSGKIDRKALPAIDIISNLNKTQSAEPSSEMEAIIHEIWCQVMGHKQINIHDDFFEIGGHSLLAMQLVAQLRKKLQIDLPVSTIFDHSTIAELAQTLGPLTH